MARAFTLAQLTSRCKQRCDLENSSLISTTEWQQMISSAFGRLYGELVKSGLRYFETTQTLTATTTALPAGYLSTIGVEFVVDAAGNRRALRELSYHDRSMYRAATGGESLAYALEGTNIVLHPALTSGQSYIHTYVPQPTDYTSSADSTSVDVVTPDGEEFVTWAVAVMALHKEESDTSVAMRERDLALARVQEWALERTLTTMRPRVTDEYGFDIDPADYHRLLYR